MKVNEKLGFMLEEIKSKGGFRMMQQMEYIHTMQEVYDAFRKQLKWDEDISIKAASVIVEQMAKDRRTKYITETKNHTPEIPESATPRQKEFMGKLGIQFDKEITKQQAMQFIQ